MFKISLASFVALASATEFAGERSLSDYTYANYVKEFKKNYGNYENNQREAIFNANLELIKKQNSEADKTWFATVNKYTDLTNSEFNKLYHGHKAHTPGSLPQATVSEFKTTDLPDSVDWRTISGVVTPVKDQGGCGSCWAFSATETLESAYAIATYEKAPILSPQQIVSCAPDPDECGGTGGCAGSTQPLAFNYTSSAGITTEASYSYQGRTGTCNQDKIKPVVINEGFVSLKVNDYTELVTAVAMVGPVAISVAAGGFGWQIYGGGIYSKANDFVMDHAVQLVGYGSEGSQDYWIVRNSWGSGWGESGYMRVARYGEGKEPCGMDNNPADGDACKGDNTPREYCGVCGILSSSSYPTGVRKA